MLRHNVRLTTACTTDVLAVQSCRTTLLTCRTCNLVGCECITQPWPGPCMVISHTPCICMLNNKCAVQVSQQPHRPAGAPEQQLFLTAWRTLFATCIHQLFHPNHHYTTGSRTTAGSRLQGTSCCARWWTPRPPLLRQAA